MLKNVLNRIGLFLQIASWGALIVLVGGKALEIFVPSIGEPYRGSFYLMLILLGIKILSEEFFGYRATVTVAVRALQLLLLVVTWMLVFLIEVRLLRLFGLQWGGYWGLYVHGTIAIAVGLYLWSSVLGPLERLITRC